MEQVSKSYPQFWPFFLSYPEVKAQRFNFGDRNHCQLYGVDFTHSSWPSEIHLISFGLLVLIVLASVLPLSSIVRMISALLLGGLSSSAACLFLFIFYFPDLMFSSFVLAPVVFVFWILGFIFSWWKTRSAFDFRYYAYSLTLLTFITVFMALWPGLKVGKLYEFPMILAFYPLVLIFGMLCVLVIEPIKSKL